MHKGLSVLLGVGAVGGIIAGIAGVMIIVGTIRAHRAAVKK
jgi:hypothetical protein